MGVAEPLRFVRTILLVVPFAPPVVRKLTAAPAERAATSEKVRLRLPLLP